MMAGGKFGIVAFAGLALALLAGCGEDPNAIRFDGQVFKGKGKGDRSDRAYFVATAGPASVSLEGARQAAVYEAYKYCLEYLGTSDIAWENGPDVEDTALQIEDDKLLLSGRCIEP
ncbi:MAG: hypothetical protein KDK26_15810 [Roseivivax sp.]|nr:hypothetical protein [Roseivivax sp.]